MGWETGSDSAAGAVAASVTLMLAAFWSCGQSNAPPTLGAVDGGPAAGVFDLGRYPGAAARRTPHP